MKKVMGLIVLAMMILLPVGVNAALDFSGFTCDDRVVADDGSVTKTCYIRGKATDGSSINQFTGTLTLQNMSVKSITASSPWTNNNGNSTNLSFSASTSVTNSDFTIATIVLSVNNLAEKCAVQFIPCYDDNGFGCRNTVEVTENHVCKIVDGKYYGKNGTEVTAEVYNAECINNPQTGNFVPYIVIIAGIALAIGVFTISRKNTKLYKI